jgi:predicted DCC family thiol-disulfide oxidoreductase YuxK
MARPILLYDGDCGFCTSSARFVERRIPVSAEVSPFQFTDVEALGTTAARARHEVLWVENGRVYGGAQAVAMLFTRAGGLWGPLGLIMRVPPVCWIAAGVYRLVSANRYRLPGGTPACRLPRRP